MECKQILIKNLISEFKPIWEKIDYYRDHPSQVDEILDQCARRASEESEATMQKVRAAMRMSG